MIDLDGSFAEHGVGEGVTLADRDRGGLVRWVTSPIA